jgi:hypothetical protein
MKARQCRSLSHPRTLHRRRIGSGSELTLAHVDSKLLDSVDIMLVNQFCRPVADTIIEELGG